MREKLLKDLIEERVPLGRMAATGFRALRCLSCNDHSERAGFKLDGDVVIYSCFNCGLKALYEEGSGKVSRSLRKILQQYGISTQDIDEVIGSAFFVKNDEPREISTETLKQKVSLFTPEVELPPQSFPIGADHNHQLQIPVAEYLLSRKLDPVQLNVHFSTHPKYLNRAIIPAMRDGKIIFWQARAIFPTDKPRYISCSASREAVLWGYDNIWKNRQTPLFITEGLFDAASIDGVALLGSTLNEAKLEVLNRCSRDKVVVIDRDANGGKLGEVALQNGWDVTFVDAAAKDVNDSTCKFGILYTAYSLVQNRTRPTGLKSANGVSVKSELELKMQLALAKMKGHR